MNKPYEAPTVKTIGSLHELTLLTNKDYNPLTDGYTFQGHVISTAS